MPDRRAATSAEQSCPRLVLCVRSVALAAVLGGLPHSSWLRDRSKKDSAARRAGTVPVRALLLRLISRSCDILLQLAGSWPAHTRGVCGAFARSTTCIQQRRIGCTCCTMQHLTAMHTPVKLPSSRCTVCRLLRLLHAAGSVPFRPRLLLRSLQRAVQHSFQQVVKLPQCVNRQCTQPNAAATQGTA